MTYFIFYGNNISLRSINWYVALKEVLDKLTYQFSEMRMLIAKGINYISSDIHELSSEIQSIE
jgi:hypothetical protein